MAELPLCGGTALTMNPRRSTGVGRCGRGRACRRLGDSRGRANGGNMQLRGTQCTQPEWG